MAPEEATCSYLCPTLASCLFRGIWNARTPAKSVSTANLSHLHLPPFFICSFTVTGPEVLGTLLYGVPVHLPS